MMKQFISSCALMMALSPALAHADVVAGSETTDVKTAETAEVQQTESPSTLEQILAKMPKISGYLQTGWNYTDQGKGSSSFQAKRLRLLMDGQVIKNVTFRLQIEAFNGIKGSRNGNGQKNIQVMDAFATAKISDAVKIRAGQYYLPLGFENYDCSPSSLETIDFSNICYRMVCRNPISYNLVDYGRDLGVMVCGELFPNEEKGFHYLHYDLSLSNGNMPMKDDNNKSKDVIGALTFHPTKLISIKGTYNYGEYASETTLGGVGTWKYKRMNRYMLGAWYNDPMGLDLRAEYGHMQAGSAVKEDGAYVLAAYHVGDWLPVVRYDMYRDNVNKTTLNNYDRVLLGVSYCILKNLKLQANYGYSIYTNAAKVASNNNHRGSSQVQLMAMYKF